MGGRRVWRDVREELLSVRVGVQETQRRGESHEGQGQRINHGACGTASASTCARLCEAESRVSGGLVRARKEGGRTVEDHQVSEASLQTCWRRGDGLTASCGPSETGCSTSSSLSSRHRSLRKLFAPVATRPTVLCGRLACTASPHFALYTVRHRLNEDPMDRKRSRPGSFLVTRSAWRMPRRICSDANVARSHKCMIWLRHTLSELDRIYPNIEGLSRNVLRHFVHCMRSYVPA